MKTYDKYKDSGIEWIGEIPEHWEEIQLGRIGKFTSSGINKKISEDELEVKIINYTDVYGNSKFYLDDTIDYMVVTDTENKIREHSVNKGDLIFTPSSETIEDIGVSAVVIEDLENTAFSYHVLRYQFDRKLDLHFKKYLCNNNFVLNYFSKNAQGTTRQTLDRNDFKKTTVLIPSFEEQTAIASYLDQKTAEIDELLSDKKRLLELYEEEKIAIINQAVTKGINPDVKMKDSGIEWLGEIPEHWEVKRLKSVVSKVGSGVTPRGGAEVYQTTGIPLLRSQNIYNDGLKLEDVAYISEEIHNSMSNSEVLSGDVLLNITGGSIGRAFYIEDWLGKANVNQHVCIIRPRDIIITRFLFLVLISQIGQEQIEFEQTGSGREGLNFESLKNFIIPFPCIQEQQSIVHYIETETARIDAKISKTEKLIELLEEYRAALISEVVTGKVKVCG